MSRPQAPRCPAADRPPGTLIGRYVVVNPIARGGMGAVMLAYDTLLARQVALKVMLTSVATEEARQRMLREAQAMARLAHPNVVGIYDVGVHDGDVFFAMEYVNGVSLRDWLMEPRSRRDVLAVMKQAGRGLAAAHEASIIHRDFKPSNVIVTHDLRAYVLDFGIARGLGSGEDSPPPHRPGVGPESLLDSTMTQEGYLVGTTGYAAPEVINGRRADARADVFSFSVTLWRALSGSMPYPSSGLDQYLMAVNGTDPVLAPERKLPQWLRAVLARGLERDPAARFTSMKEILAALEANPWKKRVVALACASAIAAAATGALGKARHDMAMRAACRAEGDAVATSWSPGSREAAQRAMLAETDPGAPDRARRTLERLDDYARAWRAEMTDSCEATRVRKTQSVAVHEKRSQCLLGARTELEFLSEVLASDDRVSHRSSLRASGALPLPENCTATANDDAFLALPAGAAERAAAVAARREVLRAQVLYQSGDLRESRRLAEHTVALARDAGDGELEARAEYLWGRNMLSRVEIDEARRHFREAIARAEGVGADHIAGMAAANLAALIIVNQSPKDVDEGLEWLGLARGKLARLGRDEPLELKILVTDVDVDMSRDPRAALEKNARAIDLEKRVNGDLQTGYCVVLNRRGLIFEALGDPVGAEAWLRQAVDCQLRATGPDDPKLTHLCLNLGDVEMSLGRWDDAMASLNRAVELRRALDPNDNQLATLFAMEAIALDGAERYEEAERAARRALDSPAEDEQPRITALHGLGLARAGQGDPGGARVACARALDVSRHPPDPAKLYGEDVLLCLGEAELALGDVAAARRHLEQSASLPLRGAPGELAMARFALARALAAEGGRRTSPPDTARARVLAEQARDELRDAAPAYPFRQRQLDDVEHWLTEQGVTSR